MNNNISQFATDFRTIVVDPIIDIVTNHNRQHMQSYVAVVAGMSVVLSFAVVGPTYIYFMYIIGAAFITAYEVVRLHTTNNVPLESALAEYRLIMLVIWMPVLFGAVFGGLALLAG